MDQRVYIVVGIIVVTGLLGGYGAFLMEPSENPSAASSRQALRRSLFLGVIAALMVPLFLSLTKSGLMGNIFAPKSVPPKPPAFEDYLIFAGLCVLAAVSARRFISSVTERLLQRVDEVERTAAHAEKTAEQAKAEVQEGEEADDPKAPRPLGIDQMARLPRELESGTITLSPDERNALQALTSKTYRTRTGVAEDSGISRTRISEVLDDLYAKKLAVPTKSPKTGGMRWIITKAGEAALQQES